MARAALVHGGSVLCLVMAAIACSADVSDEARNGAGATQALAGQDQGTSGGSADSGGSAGAAGGGGAVIETGGSPSGGATSPSGGADGGGAPSGGASSGASGGADGGGAPSGGISSGGSATVGGGAGAFGGGAGGEGTTDRMAWWQEARFGMFIHWGAYAELRGWWQGQPVEGLGEWIMFDAGISVADYEAQAVAPFEPTEFDAASWVRLAKEAGQRYIVITSKHHDGFSMFGTDVDDFAPYSSVQATTWGRDPLEELARECRAQGIRLGAYYSIMDWHHPLQSDWGESLQNKPEYVAQMKAQLAELVEKYDVDLLWFDGEWQDWWTTEDGADLYAFLLGLKPTLIVNNRVGKRAVGDGDFGTPEQEIPPTGLAYDWESCMTINDTWGYKDYDENWKTATTLIRNLVDIASKGGNYLLNVGPTETGVIPAPSADRLRAIGAWLAVYGESIYATSPSIFPETFAWGKVTVAPEKIYLHVTDWPEADPELSIPSVSRQVERVYPLHDTDQTYPHAVDGDGITISLPEAAPNEHVSVVVVSLVEG